MIYADVAVSCAKAACMRAPEELPIACMLRAMGKCGTHACVATSEHRLERRVHLEATVPSRRGDQIEDLILALAARGNR